MYINKISDKLIQKMLKKRKKKKTYTENKHLIIISLTQIFIILVTQLMQRILFYKSYI